MENTDERKIFLRKPWASPTIHSIQLKNHSMQRANERHSKSKLFMAFLEVTIISTEVKIPVLLHIPPSMHLHHIVKTIGFLVKYFQYFQVFIFVVLWLFVGNVAATNLQIDMCKINLISME